MLQRWPSFKFDERDPAGVWSSAIDDLSVEQIKHGIGYLGKVSDSYPWGCGEFRGLCLTYRVQPSNVPRLQYSVSDKEQASKICHIRLVQRICGFELPERDTTPFDYDAVVNAVHIDWPERNKERAIAGGMGKRGAAHLSRHDAQYFDRLRVEFEKRWMA